MISNPSASFMTQPNNPNGNPMTANQLNSLMFDMLKMQKRPFLSRVPNFHLPAIFLFALSWLLHSLATFIPYWSTYTTIRDSRAGLWNARNFNYTTIQNFYFPEPNQFVTLTDSIKFTQANTKGYLVTVQFLMTFNFVLMFIVLLLLIIDYAFSRQPERQSRSLLNSEYNTSDTVIKYALLLFIIYVFAIFEFAAWITYVVSRHDNNWTMSASFALAVIVSFFLILIFIMYTLEFLKRSKKTRSNWTYWYGPNIEWGMFFYLSALILLLLVICCPEWGYFKIDSLFLYAEIGLFKQCLLSVIYKKSLGETFCSLSHSPGNQSWVNAAQAFMLIAYIIGMIILLLIFIFRKEFRHYEMGYYAERVSQPTFTFVMAGLIMFFCAGFTLIGIAIFGANVFTLSIKVNWGYIVAILSVVLFLMAGIFFILDGIHSEKQSSLMETSSTKKLFFPAPLNQRISMMEPLLRSKPLQQPQIQLSNQINPLSWQQQGMNNMPNFANTNFFPPPQMNMLPMNNYNAQNPNFPVGQALLANYFQQMQNNPQISSLYPGLNNYGINQPSNFSSDNQLNDASRKQFVQLQRLNYNHERLLERYNRIIPPRMSEFSTFGSTTLPGRNYNDYLHMLQPNLDQQNPMVTLSRFGIRSFDEMYPTPINSSSQQLPININSTWNYNRNEPMAYVRSEKSANIKFPSIFSYLRSLYKKSTKFVDDTDENQLTITPSGYLSCQDQKIINKNYFPINPCLFNIFVQRLNGYIESYGQNFYEPYTHHKCEKESNGCKSVLLHTSSFYESNNQNLLLTSANNCDPLFNIISEDFSTDQQNIDGNLWNSKKYDEIAHTSSSSSDVIISYNKSPSSNIGNASNIN